MLNHQGTVMIHTQRLLLRPYVQGDEAAMFANWANDPEVTRYLTWAPHGNISVTTELIAQWEARYMSDTVYHWGITLDGELIGDIAVVTWSEPNESAELGYCLARRFWGQGIMTEALGSVMRYLFHTIGFHRITLKHDAQNPASGRVMEKAGLLYEGRLRGAYKRLDGTFTDVCVYGALRGQWPGKEGA